MTAIVTFPSNPKVHLGLATMSRVIDYGFYNFLVEVLACYLSRIEFGVVVIERV
jgi:hypothetical protein